MFSQTVYQTGVVDKLTYLPTFVLTYSHTYLVSLRLRKVWSQRVGPAITVKSGLLKNNTLDNTCDILQIVTGSEMGVGVNSVGFDRGCTY